MMTRLSLESALAPPDYAIVQRAGKAANAAGIQLYLVGGCVRDALLGRQVYDLDFVSETSAAIVADVLKDQIGASLQARSQFLTVKIALEDRLLDIATARSETYQHPGALPTVRPGAMEQDAVRRDFSINAMYVKLWPDEWGALYDPANGQRDLERRILRGLHERTFQDDATRMLRAVRYCCRLGFKLDPATRRWLTRDLGYMETISPPRARHEFIRLLQEGDAVRCLRFAQARGILAAVFQSLDESGVRQAIAKAGRQKPGWMELLALLVYPLSHEDADGLIQRLALSAAEQAPVQDVHKVKALDSLLSDPDIKPHTVVRMLDGLSEHAIHAAAVLAESPAARQRLRRYLNTWRHIRPHLKGNDLMALGLKPGPEMGALLEELREARVDGRVRTEADERAYVARWLRERT